MNIIITGYMGSGKSVIGRELSLKLDRNFIDLDSYIERLKNLEQIAMEFDGVEKAYAIQAGRELRVMVESEKISDDQSSELSFEISQKIQTEMTYPGQVKVTVIRETRSVNIAK